MGKKAKAKKHRSRSIASLPVVDELRPTTRIRKDAAPRGSEEGPAAAPDAEALARDGDPAELAARLVSIGARLGRQLGHGADQDGLTRSRLSALGRLVLGGPATLGQLAAHEGVRPPTMTRLVRSMEAAGLVARQRHPTDGRSVLLMATPAGEASLASGEASRVAPLATAIVSLDGEMRRDLGQATAVLDRFLLGLDGARRRI